MEQTIVRGKELEPVPESCFILRAVKTRLSNEAAAPPLANPYDFDDLFVLSDGDKAEVPPALSVYVEGLTTLAQVMSLLSSPTRYGAVTRLSVEAVRTVSVPLPNGSCLTGLDVLWIKAHLPDGSDDTRPGAEGHAGLIGLNRPKGADKYAYKALRDALVVLARQDCRSREEGEAGRAAAPPS